LLQPHQGKCQEEKQMIRAQHWVGEATQHAIEHAGLQLADIGKMVCLDWAKGANAD
jgi:hypothetical protein